MNYNQAPMKIDDQGNQFPSHPYAHSQLGYGERFNPEGDNDSIDLLKLLWFVVHYRWLIAACLIIGLVCGAFFTFLQTPKYRATAVMEIQTASATKALQDLEVFATSNDWRVFETTLAKMKSRELAARVSYELDLANKPDFLAPAPSFSLSNIFRRISGSTPQLEFDDISPEQRANLASGLVSSGLSVALVDRTSLVHVSFSHPLPQYAESVANQYVRSYLDQNVDKRSETSGLAREFIEEQVLETKEKLQVSEKALVAYAQKEGITLTGNDTSLVSENISAINQAISKAVEERLDIARLVKQIEDGGSTTLPDVSESESIQSNKQKIAELKATYQQKLSTLKPSFPEMVSLRAQFNELQNQINLEIEAIARSTKALYEQRFDKEKALREELADLERRQSEFQQKNIQYTILKREVDSNRAQYESLIGKLNEVGVGSDLRSSNASIVDLAGRPGSPYTPRLSRNMAIAFAFFAMLAAGIIFLLELLNNTFSTPDQIESDLKLTVLGIVPKVPEASLENDLNNPQSGLSEAYRTLRTSLQFSGTDAGLKTLVVTSSEPSEGKSTTSFQIAKNFANLGKNVLVIDADLRKPRMHRILNTDNVTGLSNLLTNVVLTGGVESVFQSTDYPNLSFMSSGTIPPNPADILISPRMGLLLQLCKKRYDMIIIDSPPVIGLSDAPILARQADATLLVVATKQSTRKSAANALKRLKAAGANVVGAAMTKFSVDNLDYNYAYRYMQSNYYAYDGEQSGDMKLQDKRGSRDASGVKTKAGNVIAGFFNRFTARSG